MNISFGMFARRCWTNPPLKTSSLSTTWLYEAGQFWKFRIGSIRDVAKALVEDVLENRKEYLHADGSVSEKSTR